jgi:hypothetical protein
LLVPITFRSPRKGVAAMYRGLRKVGTSTSVASAPQGRGNRASGRARRTCDGQFKESGINACGILICKPDSRRRTRLTLLSQYVTAFHLARGPSQRTCDGGIVPAMLPGIRFLLAAILLSISIVVFGLGAAALLRAAHEDFASNPSWRVTPETRFAQNEMPSLALLRVETPAPAARPADVPDSVAPETNATPAAPTEQVAAVSPAPETTVAPAAPATDAMKTEAPPPGPAPSSEPSPTATASEASPPSDQANKPDAPQEAKVATTEARDAPPKASEAAPVTPEAVKPDVASSEPAKPESAKSEASSTDAAKPEQANAPPPPETTAPTKIAKLNAAAARIEEPSPTKAEARKAERAADKEKARAEKKAKARRRLAAQRARATRQVTAQRAGDPFSQLQPARTP